MKPWETEALKKSPLFEGTSDGEFDESIKCIQPKILNFKKGEVIFHANDSSQRFGVLLTGCASAYDDTSEGNRALLFSAKHGGVAGIVAAYSGDNQHSYTLFADENCTIAFIRPFFAGQNCDMKCGGTLCVIHQKILRNLLNILLNKTSYLYQRTKYLTMKSIRQKVCAYLLEQLHIQGSAIFVIPLGRAKLAEYLNIQRPSLSRELCLLRDAGLIEFHKNTFRILDHLTMVRYANASG